MSSELAGRPQGRSPLLSEHGSLLERVPVAVFGVDADDRICYWGPGAESLFGYSARAALGQPSGMLFADASGSGRDEWARMVERGRSERYWRGRLSIRHRDGTVFDGGFRVFRLAGTGGRDTVMTLASESGELERVRNNLAFLDALFESCPIGLVMFDADLRFVHLNQALADMDGMPIQEHLGQHVGDAMIMPDGGEYESMLRAVAEVGRPIVGALVGVRTRGQPDRDQVWSVSLFPLSRPGGTRLFGVGGMLVDVTDREQAIVEASAARQRLALLDRAAARIGTTLDVAVTAREIVQVAVPDFCDAAVVELVEWMNEQEPFDPALPVVTRRIASDTVLSSAASEPLSGRETARYPPGSAIHHVLQTGRPDSAQVDEAFVTSNVPDETSARLLVDSGLSTLVIAPLIARGTVQGIAMFGRPATRPAFTDQDLSLAAELTSRAALCLDNARLYSRERDIALTLQRALMPESLPAGRYVTVAHRYLPGGRVTEVGGDWYDLIQLPGRRVALVVGDVMGHGVRAAADMGGLRFTARALARRDPEPSELLAELDEFAVESGIELATCVYVVFDPAAGRTRIASAGHPPPLIRPPDGEVEILDEVLGVPLGVGGFPFRAMDIDLPEDAVLALYTDGLVESHDLDLDRGLARLRDELRDAPESLERAADRVLTQLVSVDPDDDTVLVLARVRRMPPREQPGWAGRWHLPARGRRAGRKKR
ncbi:SpoIIE family protein phosphatase [Streptomyces sp. NPDC051776]|uniref:SpoIIE family protein phosphatase n=1 Tax=Streptomyces sp. NPDC051776 TaxID=3155414 RepID=UPI003445DB17